MTATVTHLGVYGASGTLPACSTSRKPYEFVATDKWEDVTCGRCHRTDVYRQRRRRHFHAVIRSGLRPSSAADA